MTRLLIADDDELTRTGLRSLLSIESDLETPSRESGSTRGRPSRPRSP
jgi:DNA-binding NarL/FixJ family response regulator